jgi:adenine/guanine phosphoribosyltransferase-like PRPP-binding protein
MTNTDFISMIHKLGPYLEKAARKLRTNVFAVRGSSGIGVANAVRMLDLGLEFVMVRKDDEKHHGQQVEVITQYNLDFSSYIFLDDFISSGATKNAVKEAIKDAEMRGAVLYHKLKSNPEKEKLKWSSIDELETLA